MRINLLSEHHIYAYNVKKNQFYYLKIIIDLSFYFQDKRGSMSIGACYPEKFSDKVPSSLSDSFRCLSQIARSKRHLFIRTLFRLSRRQLQGDLCSHFKIVF